MSYFNSINLNSLDASLSVEQQTQLKTTLFDASGNQIDSHTMSGGMKHLGVAAIQSIYTSVNNFSEDLLNDGSTYTGTADETLGITGIQVYHASDQPSTVYVDQGVDPTFSDLDLVITDSFGTIANEAKSEVFYSVAPYYRIRVTNSGFAPFTKHITASGMTPIINPLPRALSYSASGIRGRLETETTIRDLHTHRHNKVSPTYELYSVNRNRLVGKAFIGSYNDTNFWTETSTNGGHINLAGDLELHTDIDPSGYVQYQSVHKARFVAGMVNEFVSIARFGQNPSTGYLARMGPYDSSNGVFFIIQDTSFGVATRYEGVDDIVWNGSFNGNLGPTISGNFTIPNRYDIMYGGSAIEFFIGENLIHTKYAITAPATFNVDFPINIELENTGNTADNQIHIRGCSIFRIGELHTSPVYKYLSTAGTTSILKYGAGNLHRIVNNDNTGTISIYDGLSAAGKVIAVIDMTKVLGSIEFNADFNDGLTIVNSNPTEAKFTVIYE